MKLKYIFASIVATLALAVSCEKEADHYLDGIKVSNSYVSLTTTDATNTATITVTATDSWSISMDEDAAKWLTVSPLSGNAGETTVTFSAPAAEGKNAEVLIKCGQETQRINVIQGIAEASLATCAEVIAGPDAKTFRVTGVVTNIVNTVYGNWYLVDETGTVYIYGTLDAKGAEKNFLSLGLEEGDEVTVEGPKTTYNGTVELVNVTVLKINKSLIKVESTDPEDATLPIEGGDLVVTLENKGNNLGIEIAETDKTWLGISALDGNIVTLHATANEGGDREATVVFKTTDGKKNYSATLTLTQRGAIVDITADEFNKLEDGSTQYRLKGVITKIVMDKNDPTKYNKYGNFYIQDGTGQIYVYGLLPAAGGASGQDVLTKMNAKEGDVITVIGPKGSYNGSPQMVNAICEEHVAVTAISAVDFNKLEDGSALYKVSGTITDIVMDKNDPTKYNKYGNFHIEDESGESVYVYGLVPSLDGKSGTDMLTTLGVKVGDEITVVGPKGSYKGSPQMVNAFYVSHKETASGGGEGGEDDKDFSSNVNWTIVDAAYDDGLAIVNGISEVKTLKFGTSKKNGSATLTVQAGTKELSFYGVSWKGSEASITATVNGAEKTFSLAANEGASGNAPYTMTVTASDKYTIAFDSALAADTEIPLTSAGRVILFAIKAK